MPKLSPLLQKIKQSTPTSVPGTSVPSGTAWVYERIRQAREQKMDVLDLSFHYQDPGARLTELPEEILDLLWLKALHLSGNHLSSLPETIARLPNLTTLDLHNNQLTSLPESIARLPNLTTLDLGSNRLSSLPETITRLPNLTTLDLGSNRLSSLPEPISGLTNLTTLNLGHNELSTLPESITELTNLTTLDLQNNKLSNLPESIIGLTKLIILNLHHNRFTTLPGPIIQLKNLRVLNLGNYSSDLPEWIQRIELEGESQNQLSSLPESIDQLQNLVELNLTGNQLISLPEAITRLPNLESLDVEGNPLVSPPIEIASNGIEALREYFRQLDQEGVDYLYEAKLLILGEGGAGKTTFANKILDSEYTLKDEISTKGVDVLKWSFPIEGGRQFRVNIWDFGGQEIYHATHQFFLTKRSLYALVADTRKEDTDFYYWLNAAELLSENSPLLIIKNEKQDRHRELNERSLKGQFDSLKEVLATNLETNRGLTEAKEEIKHYIRKLPHIGTRLPKTWVRVREQLEKDPHNTISLEEYLEICAANGFGETKDSLQLSGYLHDIGVFLHFQEEPMLRKTIILKPKWGTDAVYKVFDNKTVIQNLGRFTRADLERIWSAPEYASMQDELLQLMMKFKLCYEIPNERGTYIAPQLLTENQPVYKWKEEENLLLRYSYQFMPKGILLQFIVVMNRAIATVNGRSLLWRSGVVLAKAGTAAEIIEHYGKREIHVRVTGHQARDVLTIIRHELEQIHSSYKKLKYDELIQCNCPACKHNPEPHFYTIAELLDFRANGQVEIQCRKKPYHMVNVMGLLGDFIDLSKLVENNLSPNIFVQGDYVAGGKTMADKNISINNSTVHGSVVAAERIKDSFNIIEKADIKDDLKEQLKQLTQAVEAMIKEMPKEKPEQAEKVGVYMQRLSEEATKEKPDSEWYSVSINGLIAAAQNLGKVGDAVIGLAGKVKTILTSGLL
jgi:internalin A